METFKDSRTPALAIVARGNQIETVTPSEFAVRSQSRPGVTYKVTVSRARWACECPFWAKDLGGSDCIHILAARIRCGFQETAQVPETGVVCETCRSSNVVKFGVRKNKSGPVARRLCRTCGATFTGREGYHKRRASPEMIAKALDLYFRGVSLRQVADHFAQAYGLKVSRMTVYRWVVRYSQEASRWLKMQEVKVGEKWNVDETVVSVDGDKRFVWNVMDAETRFLLATHVSENRSMTNTRMPLKLAKLQARATPTEIRSDGMSSYPAAILKEYGRRRREGDAPRDWKDARKAIFTPHRVVPSIRAAESNNLVERLHGSEKDRIRPMRGFDTMQGTSALMEGYRVHYDLVRTHLALGTTPGVAAGMPEIAGFKWAEILRMATNRIVTPSAREGSSTD